MKCLREVAARIVAALPPVVDEAVLTGSVSRGVADDLPDIEMLLRMAGLVELDTWGAQKTEVSRVSSRRPSGDCSETCLDGEPRSSDCLRKGAAQAANANCYLTVKFPNMLDSWGGQ